jgi:putative DNA methylase
VTITRRKKLIEVSLPLKAINDASIRESYIYRGNPSALHKWWAQRPLAAARAVIFAQLVDDPSAWPERFPTEEAQDRERARLFDIIEAIVKWESMKDDDVLERARAEIRRSWQDAHDFGGREGEEAVDLSVETLPRFLDPFSGGGSLPLEAQRLGLHAWASDLNPVAVLITRVMTEFPSRFKGRSAIGPTASGSDQIAVANWEGTGGLAEDVRRYGAWMCAEAIERIGHAYPSTEITADLARGRADLKPYIGRKLTTVAWLWARTVKSPDPASEVDVPLASTFMLSTKPGREVYVEPEIRDGAYRFRVVAGTPADRDAAKRGTKLPRGANFRCLLTGATITADWIKAEAQRGPMNARLMAVAVEGDRGRLYVPATPEHERAAREAKAGWRPEVEFFPQALGFRIGNYGMASWGDLFTERQLAMLDVLTELIPVVRQRVESDALAAGFAADGTPLDDGGGGAVAYADAIATLLSFVVSKILDYNCALVTWYSKEDRPSHLFSTQTLPMVWDFVELNPLTSVGGGLEASVRIVAEALGGCAPDGPAAHVRQRDAASHASVERDSFVISTDPPYYDNVGYADLSDFFYVWMRRSLRDMYPSLFSTVSTPKEQELVATPHRKGGSAAAE